MTTPASPRIAVVTGSSSGIGRATAIRLAQAGYWVVLHAHRNIAGLQETARLARDASPSCKTLAITADISCSSACDQLVQAAFAWKGRVDAWINNAGADVLTGQSAKLDFNARLARLLAVDVAGTIRLSRSAAVRMQDQSSELPPAIINIGWDQASLGMEGEPGQLFGPCKSAIESFTRSLALTTGRDIRVNCVCPGWIRTAWGSEQASDSWHQRAIAESLAARWGTAQDVAHAITWLVSPESAFIGGQSLNVNGGRRYAPRLGPATNDKQLN